MAKNEVGTAILTVLPSTKGFAANLSKDLDGPFSRAGRDGGRSIAKGAEGSGDKFSALGGKLGKLFAGAFAAVGIAKAATAVKDFVSDSITSASDLSETLNKSNTIFGDNADAIQRWANTAATSVGLSKGAALEAAAGFGNMFQQLGFAGDVAATMSTDVVQLSADLGSFNNLPTADVADKISAAFRGEYDSLQALIPNINAARVEQEALATTGKATAKELTAAEKAAAVLAIVHRDGAAASGDFAKTSDGLANSQKILTAELENTKAEIGTALLPVVTDLFNTFREVGVPALQDLAKWFTENEDTVRSTVIAVVDGGLLMVQALLGIGAAAMRVEALWLTWSQNMVDMFFFFVRSIVDGAAQAFGWIPGLGPKLQTASEDLGRMQTATDTAFDAMQQAALDTAETFDAGSAAVQTLRDKVLALDGTKATVTLTAQGNLTRNPDGSYRAPNGVEFRAGGGDVRAGNPYIVGENEPELFVPDRPGHIYNQSQLAAMASGDGGSGRAVEQTNYFTGLDAPAALAAMDARLRVAMQR